VYWGLSPNQTETKIICNFAIPYRSEKCCKALKDILPPLVTATPSKQPLHQQPPHQTKNDIVRCKYIDPPEECLWPSDKQPHNPCGKEEGCKKERSKHHICYTSLRIEVMESLRTDNECAKPRDNMWTGYILLGLPASNQHMFLIHRFLSKECTPMLGDLVRLFCSLHPRKFTDLLSQYPGQQWGGEWSLLRVWRRWQYCWPFWWWWWGRGGRGGMAKILHGFYIYGLIERSYHWKYSLKSTESQTQGIWGPEEIHMISLCNLRPFSSASSRQRSADLYKYVHISCSNFSQFTPHPMGGCLALTEK